MPTRSRRERSARVFVSSTAVDLDDIRQHVRDDLQRADFVPVFMEVFEASERSPTETCKKKLELCDVCVVLVSHIIGSKPSGCDATSSFTQLEIATAEKLGIPVLPFVLSLKDVDEEEVYRQRLAERPDLLEQLDKKHADAWRTKFLEQRTVQRFGLSDPPSVVPAVHLAISAQHQRRQKRRFASIAALLFTLAIALLATFLLISTSQGARDWCLRRFLAFHDPVVFSGASEHNYQISRLIDGRADLKENTDFRREISLAKKRFFMFANVFGGFHEYFGEFEKLAEQGVQLRFIVSDFSEQNRPTNTQMPNWAAFLRATESTANAEETTIGTGVFIQELMLDLQQRYPKNVEFRTSRLPILYTMWIRDPETVNALGHVGVHFYDHKSEWPAYRVSRVTGDQHIDKLAQQFDVLWKLCEPKLISKSHEPQTKR